MRSRTFVPGVIATPNAITLPADAPDIDVVVTAQIVRLPSGMTIPNHAAVAHAAAAAGPEACAGAAVADHATHAHDLVFGAAQASAVTVAVGAGAPLGAAAAGTVPGGGATGIQNFAIPAHVVTQPTITHANIVAGIDQHPAVVHGANVGTDPVVAAVPTRITARTFSLNVNTVLGDLLTLNYQEVGERVRAS